MRGGFSSPYSHFSNAVQYPIKLVEHPRTGILTLVLVVPLTLLFPKPHRLQTTGPAAAKRQTIVRQLYVPLSSRHSRLILYLLGPQAVNFLILVVYPLSLPLAQFLSCLILTLRHPRSTNANTHRMPPTNTKTRMEHNPAFRSHQGCIFGSWGQDLLYNQLIDR